ncbi:MAG: carboxypeptidase regulatory-like domain-containing protein [Cyanobacteria bacterium REEB65]|nr:carboxypeptidase regulatory-like domain-containing protein [Cyanobacteria bacterium REEB65]
MRARSLLLAVLLAGLPLQAWADCPQAPGWSPPLPLFPMPDLHPAANAVVYGYVRTTSGAPVPGAIVYAKPLSQNAKPDRTIADREGRYQLVHLVPSAVALYASHPGMATLGPLPLRIPVEENDYPFVQRIDIGGMGPAVHMPALGRSGGELTCKLLKLPGLTRDLVADHEGRVAALEMRSLVGLPLPRRAQGIAFKEIERAVSWTDDGNRLYGISGFNGSGELTAYSPAGRKILCESLPFEPTDLAVDRAGNAWVVGAREGVGVAITVDRSGKILDELSLSPGSGLRVTVDREGYGWLMDREGGLVRMTDHGKIVARLYLPVSPDLVYPTHDGGLWVVGGGTATRLDAHQRPIARIFRPVPIDLATVDDHDRLWFLESGKIVEATTTAIRSFTLAGMPINGAAGLALDRANRLWLLGLDRMRVAVARVP